MKKTRTSRKVRHAQVAFVPASTALQHAKLLLSSLSPQRRSILFNTFFTIPPEGCA
jgi:hypothetical protein